MALHVTRQQLVAIAVLVLVAVLAAPSINALPLFSDGTGPTEIEITELERLDAGCRDDVGTYASSRGGPNGTAATTTFIETGSRDANLSAWAERTSLDGADYSTFRVHVESHRQGPANESCEVGVQYRLEYRTSGGGDRGLLPDASGHSITHLANGEITGCSSVGSGRYADVGCPNYADERPPRTWANVTA